MAASEAVAAERFNRGIRVIEFIPIPPYLITAGIHRYSCQKGGRGIPMIFRAASQ